MTYPIRCSALGSIMTDAKSVDDALVTSELAAIIKKTKRTDEEKLLLEEAKSKSLSAGAKTFLKQYSQQIVYGYRETFSSKQTEKGTRVEDDSIALYNNVFLTDAVKNSERRSDEYLTGECDILLPRKGVDIKSPWTVATFPALVEDCHDSGYEWQCRGYMRLWDMPEWEVAYCLIDTPDDLIGYDPHELHKVSHIPENMRITAISYERCMEKEAKIIEKVKAAQQYIIQCIAQIKREHGE